VKSEEGGETARGGLCPSPSEIFASPLFANVTVAFSSQLENWVLVSPNAWSDLKLIDFGLSTHFERDTKGTKKMSRVVGSR
jgi:hypothetical protein